MCDLTGAPAHVFGNYAAQGLGEGLAAAGAAKAARSG
eukprot:CAMPEP_0185159554 /NCGR_PEP_ID=MMETSP1139-20130426/3114_1 /TAXON_ID=298111 /ORGANISM="Pavlova sp., Strain CCMP459" /LENGTH=36 /DNA_ID= /DNA_START= /DNA_END= /DNA_ORIENTATION=